MSLLAWLALVPPANSQQPNFIAMLSAVLQPFADAIAVANSLPRLFSVDNAVGQQLDIVGQWVGVTRNLEVPLEVYFSLDSLTLGLDQGWMQGPNDPDDGIVSLPDDQYRLLLQGKIAMNQWDGTIPGAQAAFVALFPDQTVLIQDEEDSHMLFAMLSAPDDAIQAGLFSQGYIDLSPAGVTVDGFYTPTIPGAPYFGLDAENSSISGLDVGSIP